MSAKGFLAITLLSALQLKGVSPQETVCGNIQFLKNRRDVLKYEGVIENGIRGTTKDVTKIKITSSVEVQNWETCDFTLKFTGTKFYESLGSNDVFQMIPSTDLVKRLEESHLMFTMEDGIVKSITPSSKSTQSDVLNIQRGVLSVLQVRNVDGVTEETEDDVSGSCLTTYLKRSETKLFYIEKIKDLSSCKEHHAIRSNLDGHSYNDDENAEDVQDSVYKSYSKCLYKFNPSKWGMQKAACSERFLARAFSTKNDAGAYVTIRTNLTKITSIKISKRNVPYKDFYTTSIKYDHEQPEDERAKTTAYRDNVKTLLLNLAKDHYYESKPNSAQRFFELVISFRHLKKSDLNAVLGSVNIKDKAVSTFLFDAMAQCGTPTCLTVLFQTMRTSKMQKEAMKFIPYLAFLKEPTPEVIRMLMGFYQKTNDPSLLLVITTLSYKMCRNHPGECDGSGMIGQVVKDMENNLLGMLGNDCSTKNPAKQFKIFYALKGIGNLGRPVNSMPLILDCIQNAEHINTTTAAVDATRKMELTTTVKESLHLVMIEKNNDLEKRVEVFLRLMSAPSKDDISLAIDVANDEEEVGQLRSFINSYLRSVVNNKAPSARTLSKLFKEVLQENPLSDFDPSPSRYSKAFLKSFKFMRFGGTVNGHTFFHPDSFVPRSLNFNLTTHLFGFSVNALEVKARMEGVEQLLGKYMQGDGYLSSGYLKKIFKVPTRQRRSADGKNVFEDIDAEIGVNAPSPQALVSLKIFGNELQVFNLNDIPLLNGDLDDVNVVKYIYELTKGKRNVFKHNMVVMEVTHTVPTLLGMPMKIAINGSAVVTMDVNGKMKIDMKNLLMGSKSALVTGSFQPSVSLHASGKLSVACPGVTEVGTSFLGNVHFGKKYEGSIKYVEGKELKVELKADEQQSDLLNVSYNIFHETSMKKEKINGIPKRANGYFCTDEIFDSSYTGTKICAQASFPNSYYNLSTPFFPLTGPFDIGVRSYPVDPLLTKYLFHVKKTGESYTASVSTPGASSERKYILTVGVGSDGTGIKVGVTHGDENRGVVFDYSFNKKTNEVQGTIESNLTAIPMKFYGEFFNITDSSTLNRQVGVKGNFKYKELYVQHTIFYKNTYEYWALGSKFEYARGKEVSVDLKIQYQPQMFNLSFTHPPTNTKVIATAHPSLPRIEGRINIQHADDVDIKLYGQIDISKYQVTGDVNIKPGNHIVTATGKWVPQNKHIFLNANLNGIPLNWKADLKSDRVNKVTVHRVNSNLKVGDKTLDLNILWNTFSVNYTYNVDKVKIFYGQNVFTRTPNSVAISSIIDGKFMEKYQMTFDFMRSKALHKQCTKGSYGKRKFGSCYTLHHTKEKWGYIYTMLEKDQWKTPISFLIETKGDGRKVLTAKIYEYLTWTYARRNKDFSMDIKVPKVELGVNTKVQSLTEPNTKYTVNAIIVFINDTLRNELTMKYDRSTENGDKNELALERKVDGKSMNTFVLSSVSKERSFNHIFRLVGKESSPIYTVVVKDEDSKKPDNLGEEDYLIFDMDGWKLKGLENNVKNTMTFKTSEVISKDAVEYLIKIRQFDAWAEEQPPMSDIGSLKFLADGKTQFHFFETPMTMQYKAMLKTILGKTIGKGVNIVFLDALKLDKAMVGKLSGVFQQAAISYFSTIKCNGNKVHERFIKGQISKEDIVAIALRILKFPLSSEFKTITGVDMKKSLGEDVYMKLKNSDGKNMFEFLSDLGSDLRKASATDEVLKEFSDKASKLKEILEKDQTFNIFEKELFSFLQQIANEIQKTIASKSKDKMPDLNFVTKHLPGNVREQVKKTLTDVFKVLMSWKYDVGKDPMQNLKGLIDNLENVGADSLLKLDHSTIILRSVMMKAKLPTLVDQTLKTFLTNLDHVTLVQKLSKFALQTYKVPAPHSSHITKMLNTKNVNDYFKALATTIKNNGKISTAHKEPFKKFLKTMKMSTLVQEFKKTLKTEYELDDFSITLLETLFDEGSMKSFETLPTVYTVNFVPKLLTKLLGHIENLNIPSILKKLTGFVKDKDLKKALDSFVNNKQTLNQMPAALIKLAIAKTEKKDLDEGDKILLKEVEDLSVRFVTLLSHTNKGLGQQVKELALAYYDSVQNMLTATLPKSLASRSGSMFTDIRKIIQNIKVQDLNNDATGAVEKATKDIAVTISEFLSNNLNKIITEDLMESFKDQMQKFNIGEKNLWEKKEEFVKIANDRFAFLIRLLGQFSDSEENYFAQQFTKDGKILYYKIYQSIWNTKVSNENNLKQIAALYKGLEKAAMKHILEITGDASIAVVSGKVMNIAKGFLDGETWLDVLVDLRQKNTPVINEFSSFFSNEYKGKHTIISTLNKMLYFVRGFAKSTDLISLVQQYNRDKPSLVKATYEALMQQIKEMLIAIGHAKHEGITINESVKKYIPTFLQSVSTGYKNMVKNIPKQVKLNEQAKNIVKKTFKTAKEKLKETAKRDNNIIAFLFEVLLPGMDSMVDVATNQTTISLEPGYDRCTSYMRAYYRKPFGDDTKSFEDDKELQKMIKDYSESSMCGLWNLMDDVKTMRKDKSFVDAVLDKLMEIALNALDENIKNANKNMEQVKVVLETAEKLSNKKMKNPLQETVFLIGKTLTSAIRKDPRYGHTERSLGQKLDLKSLINEKLLKSDISWTVPSTETEKEAKQYITVAVKKVSKELHEMTKKILFGIDKVKTPLSKNKFIADPIGYVKDLPNRLVQDVLKNMAGHKKLNLDSLRKLEKEIKAIYKRMSKKLSGYSGKLNKVSNNLRKIYKAKVSKYLKPAIDVLRAHNQKMNKELKEYMVTADGKGNLKSKLQLLTNKAKAMRSKYRGMQESFIKDIKKNITKEFSDKQFMKEFNENDFVENLFKEIDRDALEKVLGTLNQDIKGVLTNTIYPHVTVLVKSIDETVCKVKTNISKFYTIGEKASVISWKMPGVYQALVRWNRVTDKYGTMMSSNRNDLIQNLTTAGLTMEAVQRVLQTQMETAIEIHAKQFQTHFSKNLEKMFKSHSWYQMNAAKDPETVVEEALKQYQDYVKRVAAVANKAIQISPPDELENTAIKFLGLQKPKHELLQPISRTAYLFDQSLVTFDGKPIYLPKGLKNTHKDCLYLLSRDFLWKNFTIYLQQNKLVIELKDGKVVIDRNNNNKVEVLTRVPPLFTTMQKSTDLPVQMAFTSVVKIQPNVLRVHSLFGLTVHCRLDSFSCNFTVSGYYHNKALGLFGTNNVESSDDLRLPSGDIAFDLTEFLNAYEITKLEKCMINDISEVINEEYGDGNEESECDFLKNNENKIKLVDFQARSEAFYDVCKNERMVGAVREAYASSINKEFGPIAKFLDPLGKCSTTKSTQRYSKQKETKIVQLTILLKLLPELEKVRPHLKGILQKVQQELGQKYQRVTYTIVGYGGERVRSIPHLQTGNGEVFMDLQNALKALDRMEFKGEQTDKRQGLDALKFASELAFKQGTKIFLLFDNDESFTNSLQEMINVNNALNDRGIVLDVVNTYKMRRGVIGKDSSGKRYHIREPLGEDFSTVSFPPPDDYIPLVKQSRGAVFTLKAFTSNAKWSKALPITLSSALKLQAKIDQNQCKECSCGTCKNVMNELCDIDI